MIRTVVHDVRASLTLASALRTESADGTGVAWGAYRAAGVIVLAGTITDGTHTIEIQDSDDDSTYAAVADALLDGAEPALEAADSDSVRLIGYLGVRKYLRATVAVTGSPGTGGVVSAVVVALDPYQRPGPR